MRTKSRWISCPKSSRTCSKHAALRLPLLLVHSCPSLTDVHSGGKSKIVPRRNRRFFEESVSYLQTSASSTTRCLCIQVRKFDRHANDATSVRKRTWETTKKTLQCGKINARHTLNSSLNIIVVPHSPSKSHFENKVNFLGCSTNLAAPRLPYFTSQF